MYRSCVYYSKSCSVTSPPCRRASYVSSSTATDDTPSRPSTVTSSLPFCRRHRSNDVSIHISNANTYCRLLRQRIHCIQQGQSGRYSEPRPVDVVGSDKWMCGVIPVVDHPQNHVREQCILYIEYMSYTGAFSTAPRPDRARDENSSNQHSIAVLNWRTVMCSSETSPH